MTVPSSSTSTTPHQEAQQVTAGLDIPIIPTDVCLFVVDDEPMVTASITAFLELETNYQIVTFNQPELALKAMAKHQPALVLSDFLMPNMDGITFLSQVRKQSPDTTLMLLTGYADKESAIKAINEVGIYKYIEKPWNNDELKHSIEKGLERAFLIQALKTANQSLEAQVQAKTADLQKTLTQLEEVLAHTADGIITINTQGQILSTNPTFAHWANGTESQTITACVFPVGQHARKPLQWQPADAITAPQEVHLGEPDQQTLEMSLAWLPDNSQAVLVFRDITKRKTIERLRDDFISTLTHDLRTPLLAAIQNMGFIADGSLGPLTEKQKMVAEGLIASNQDLLGLVNALLEVYKYESGKQRLVKGAVAMDELIQSILQELQGLASPRGLTLSAQPFSESCSTMVQGDKQELKRVFTNLIGNAIYHAQAKQAITVYFHPEEAIDASTNLQPLLTIEVKDDGRGIPAADLPLLFQRFSQGTSRVRSSGSGLGLYLSRQIVEAHGGHIWVESEEGLGTSFFVQLPLISG